MTGIPRSATNPDAVRAQRRRDRHKAELDELLAHPPEKSRRCPVCGEPPGKGFNTYCSTAHMFAGPYWRHQKAKAS